MRAVVLLALALPVAADEIAKAQAIAKAGPEAARAAVPELIALGKGAPLERFAARDALVVAGPPALAKLIGEAGGNPSLRLLLEGVSHDLGAGVVAPALPLLASEDKKVRAMAAVSLGAAGAGGEAAVKQLVTALHDKDAEVRREAALAIGRIGRGAHDAIPGLIHLANDPERGCTREALLALGMIVRDAAERDRRGTKVSPEVARAIEKGLAWLARQQRPEGWWAVPASADAPAPETVRVYVASLALLALLEGGDPSRHATQLRAGLRYVVATDASAGRYPFEAPWWVTGETVAATLCAATRILGDPECRSVAPPEARALAEGESDLARGWGSVLVLEADFAGLLLLRRKEIYEAGPGVTALARISAGGDPTSDEMRRLLDECVAEASADPERLVLAARARWYGGLRSGSLVEAVLTGQREDGSWGQDRGSLGPAHTTACMLLALEAASGLAHPLTMPLPDAPQLRAAVATLRIAAQSKNEEIRAAAEQALGGFAVR
jgi:HEAT repeat protein